ncbi:hypothetical protein PtB15_18B482 [Puccinia triticina]|nr:hypothetical protein PtB15_18B482 [Puccinia triticina]
MYNKADPVPLLDQFKNYALGLASFEGTAIGPEGDAPGSEFASDDDEAQWIAKEALSDTSQQEQEGKSRLDAGTAADRKKLDIWLKNNPLWRASVERTSVGSGRRGSEVPSEDNDGQKIIFGSMTLVTLAHHNLGISDDEIFEDYTYVGVGGCAIRMPPEFKQRVLDLLFDDYHIIAHKSHNPTVLNNGSPSCTAGMLEEMLTTAQVPELRLASYGMKCPFGLVLYNLGGGVPRSLAPHQEKNHFDIGYTYYPYLGTDRFRNEILLTRRPPDLPQFGSTCYPLLLELGEGYGTVNLIPDHEAITQIKVYSTLAHALKATSQKDMKYVPTTAVTWNTRVDLCEGKVEILEKNDPAHLCGLRFEATVYARSANEALEIVGRAGYLHPRAYDQTPDNPNLRLALEWKAIPVSEYFDYAHKMIAMVRRVQLEVPQKHDNRKGIQEHHRQVIVNLANAIGKGKRTYPVGSLTSVGGKGNIILQCNHCKKNTSTQEEVVVLLANWINSLGMPLLDQKNRRHGKGGWRRGNRKLTPTPSPPPTWGSSTAWRSQPFTPAHQSQEAPHPDNNSPPVESASSDKQSTEKPAATSEKVPMTKLSDQVDKDIEDLKSKDHPSSNTKLPSKPLEKPASSNILQLEGKVSKRALEKIVAAHDPNKLVGWRGFADFLLRENLWRNSSATLKHIPGPNQTYLLGALHGWKRSGGFIGGDGNYLFRAVASWVHDDQEGHGKARDACFRELEGNKDVYSPYVSKEDLMEDHPVHETMVYPMFLVKSRSSTFWGGDQHLAALAQAYQVKIVVLNELSQTCMHQPHKGKPKKTIYLWYNGQNHYEILWNNFLHSASTLSSEKSTNVGSAPGSPSPKTPQKDLQPTKSSLKPPANIPDPAPEKGNATQAPVPTVQEEKVFKTVSFDDLPPAPSVPADAPLDNLDPGAKATSPSPTNPTDPPAEHKSVISTIRDKKNQVTSGDENQTGQIKRFPVVVIPARVTHGNLSSTAQPGAASTYPWNQPATMPAMPTKKKRIRILGLQKKHGLPVVEGYWDVANARLELENGVGCKTLPYGTMQFASPLGLLEGWRISHQVIESTEDVKVPDLTGFFHAVSYWLHGVQVYYNQVRKQIIGEMDGQLRQRKTGRLPSGKNFSLFAGDDIFTIDEIDTSHLRTIEGKKPDAAIYITTANLSQAVIVVIELGAKQAKWKDQDGPQQLLLLFGSICRGGVV